MFGLGSSKKKHQKSLSSHDLDILNQGGFTDVKAIKDLHEALRVSKAIVKKKEDDLAETMKQRQELDKLRKIKEENDLIIERLRKEEEDEHMKRKGEVMERTEMSQVRVDITQPTMCLVDRFESHRAGTYMKNVVISNKAPPERELNLSRLRTYKAENEYARISLNDIEPFDLMSEFVDLPIIRALPDGILTDQKPYVLVSDIFIHYMPMDTFFSTSFVVDFFINDFRKTENVAVRHFPLSHTGGYNVLFSLDYCVRTVDLKYLTLSISTSLNSFKKNVAWASVKTNISLTFMDFPIKTSMQETMGVLHLSDSDLQDFISDPRHSDGVITPEAFKLLKQAHKRGDIEKMNQNVDDRKEMNQAKTTFEKQDGTVAVADLMRDMREDALKKQREQNQGTSVKSIPSAMKKSPKSKPMSPPAPSVKDESDEDISPGDSLSQVSDDGTIDLPRNPPVGQKRTVNFGHSD